MGIFDSMLNKLGINKDDEESIVVSQAEIPVEPTFSEEAVVVSSDMADEVVAPYVEATETIIEEAPSAAIVEVDVMSVMEDLATANPANLNWKSSIVDLLKLLGLDSSYGARKELAAELYCPAEKMEDSAQMNMWLHKTVLQKIAENGGNIPADLLG